MYRDPFDEISKLHEEMENIFNRMYRPGLADRSAPALKSTFRSPVVEMDEGDKEIGLCFELPGVDKKDIKLNMEDNIVELKVEKQEQEEDRSGYRKMSRNFYRRIPLQVEVDPENAQAEYMDGILNLKLPKKQAGEKRKQIEIR